eukprot:scaffold4310_cov123-Isochrysis_galbana.AAC.4
MPDRRGTLSCASSPLRPHPNVRTPCPEACASSPRQVAQLASYVADVTQYHHGEAALVQTIVKMAQVLARHGQARWRPDRVARDVEWGSPLPLPPLHPPSAGLCWRVQRAAARAARSVRNPRAWRQRRRLGAIHLHPPLAHHPGTLPSGAWPQPTRLTPTLLM